MKRFVFALDLANDREAIAEYEAWHRADRIRPAVVASLRSSGTAPHSKSSAPGTSASVSSWRRRTIPRRPKAAADAANPDVQAWERLMWTFQRALPWAVPGEKWVSMERIFSLTGPCRRRSALSCPRSSSRAPAPCRFAG